jgi:hypothetical protein
MKLATRAKWGGALCAGLLLALCSMASTAATTAGTSVANKATVNYSVGTVAQAAIESSPTGNTTSGVGNGTATAFLVDNKLLLTVAKVDSTIVSATPNSTTAATAFTVENDGNAVQDAILSIVNEPTTTANPFTGTGSSGFAITTSAIHADSNSNGVYDPATDTTVITSLASMAVGAGGKKTVFVVSTIPGTATNGQFGVVALVADVGAAGSGTAYGTDDSAVAWDPTVVQNIFADGAPSSTAATGDAIHDGTASDRDAYLIQSAELTITKTSAVITDPVYCTTPGSAASCTLTGGKVLHALPGAVMRYTITIASCAVATCPGAQTATGISVSDDLTAQASNIVYVAGTTTETVAGTPVTPCTDAADADACSFASNTVTVGNMTLNPGETASVTFDVTIQ